MVGCSAVNCKNNTNQGFRMFRFPTDPQRKKLWINNSRREDYNPQTTYRLCETHFEENQYEKNREDGWLRLRPNAVPTIFDVPNPPPRFKLECRKSIYKVQLPRSNYTNSTNGEGRTYKYKPIQNEIVETQISETESTDNTQVFDDCDSVSMSKEEYEKKLMEFQTNLNKMTKEKEEMKLALQAEIERLATEDVCLRTQVKDLKKNLDQCHTILKSLFEEDQIKSFSCQKMKEWSRATIIKSLKIRFNLGIRGYNYLQELGYPIPSTRTLCRKIENHRIEPGILYDLLQLLKQKVDCLQPLDRYCAISVDEMQISPSHDYDKYRKKFMGKVTLGDSNKVATHLLVVLLRGLKSPWKQVIACAATTGNTSAEDQKKFLLECIDYAESCNLHVVAITSDMGGSNVRLWSHLGVHAGKDGIFSNYIIRNGRKIYIIPDVCHLLKNLRNALQTQEIQLPDEISEKYNLPTTIISGIYIRTLWQAELRGDKPIRSLYHLSPEDIDPNGFQKMNVGSAVRYFSDRTAAALELAIEMNLLPKEAKSTAWFIRLIAAWFELVTSRIRKKSITKRNQEKKLQLLTDVLNVMQNIKIGRSVWKPLNSGFTLSTSSLIDISKQLFENGFEFILFHRLNQDALENVFSQVRRRAGKTPTFSECLQAVKLITVSQFISATHTGSYIQDSDEFLLDYFSNNSQRQMKQDEISNIPVPNPNEIFPTYKLEDKSLGDFGFNKYDINLLFYICGSNINYCLNSLYLCENCQNFLKTNPVDDSEFNKYTKLMDKGGLKTPNYSTLNLVLNCELIYRKYENFIIKSNDNKKLINKIISDLNLPFPQCSTCLCLKTKIVNFFFNTRSSAVTTIDSFKKRKKILYGTATKKIVKRRK